MQESYEVAHFSLRLALYRATVVLICTYVFTVYKFKLSKLKVSNVAFTLLDGKVQSLIKIQELYFSELN